MTDEEIEKEAKKYAHDKMSFCEDYDFDYKTAELYIEQGVLYGFAEGRKGENENIKKIQEFRKIDQEQILEQMDKISELEKENAELKERLQIESQSLHEQCEIVSRQVAQIENLKMVASSWIMSLMDVRESEVNDRHYAVLREIERRMKELEK